jgi:hypothetical protein
MPIRIAFLAISQPHQYLHWIATALRLADESDVELTVFVSTEAGMEFIRSYDPKGKLTLRRLRQPPMSEGALFSPPPRVPTLLLNLDRLWDFDFIVTTETTSGLLRRVPGFRPRLLLIKHGAGDREGSYNPKHRYFDRVLVNGDKHREALIERKLVDPANIVVTGNAKLDVIREPAPIFGDHKPLAFYNPHFDRQLSTWFGHAREILDTMAMIDGWNFIVAPHIKLRGGSDVRVETPNILIDRGSSRSIDMSYTQQADVYIGDVSSQVYEFILTPRPCIFLNFDRRNWVDDPSFAHWKFGQVIEAVEDLEPALSRAAALQPGFEAEQRRMLSRSLDRAGQSGSERQAKAILEFAEDFIRPHRR